MPTFAWINSDMAVIMAFHLKGDLSHKTNFVMS